MHTRILLTSTKLKPAVVSACMKEFGFDLETVTPERAEQTGQYDLVIMDAEGSKDFSYIGDLKRVCPWVAVLALLPFGDEMAERRASEQGADDMLCLPVTGVRLKHTLHNLIRVRMLERVVAATKRLAAA